MRTNSSAPRVPTTTPSPLAEFAFLGGQAFTSKLQYLTRLAENENWYYDSPNAQNDIQKEIGVLFQYIHHTFARAQDESKIYTTDSNAIFNTGLFTPNGEEIYALFEKNRNREQKSKAQIWFLVSFYQASSNRIPEDLRGNLPEYVDYFKDHPEDMYFDTTKKIFINVDHILEDNFDRLPVDLRAFPLDILKMLFINADTIMRRRISRNNRLVVPQYYNKQIMYLAPLRISSHTIPLAIEKNQDTYRINTIFTHGMAYCNARLLMKPESNWLTNERGVSKLAKPTVVEQSTFAP
jgi:hypothetical protein